jgi:hypothetical protein
LETREGYGNGTILLQATIVTDKGRQTIDTNITIKAIVYPTSSNTFIVGNSTLHEEFEKFSLSYPESVTGRISAKWSLEELNGYAIIDFQNSEYCVVKKLQEVAMSEVGILTCNVSKADGTNLFTLEKEIEIVNDTIAEVDTGICKALYDAGLCANETFITKEEAARITAQDLQPGTQSTTSVFYPQKDKIKSFNGFKHFVNVTYLGENCFYGYNLTSIEFPPSLKRIESYALASNQFNYIELPAGVTALDDDSFSNCGALISIKLSTELTSIGGACFYGCVSLASIEIPSGVTSLSNQCFYSCIGLTSVKLPSGITSMGNDCFRGCTNLTSINFPSSLTSLGSNCFSDCRALSSIELPSSITSLGESCFANCSALTSVKLPTGLKTMGFGCFSNSGLKSVEIPSGLTNLGDAAFQYCKALKTIISMPTNAPSVGSSSFGSGGTSYTGRNSYNTSENMLYVPAEATGYDTSYWLDPLQNTEKCGFTLSKTL